MMGRCIHSWGNRESYAQEIWFVPIFGSFDGLYFILLPGILLWLEDNLLLDECNYYFDYCADISLARNTLLANRERKKWRSPVRLGKLLELPFLKDSTFFTGNHWYIFAEEIMSVWEKSFMTLKVLRNQRTLSQRYLCQALLNQESFGNHSHVLESFVFFFVYHAFQSYPTTLLHFWIKLV